MQHPLLPGGGGENRRRIESLARSTACVLWSVLRRKGREGEDHQMASYPVRVKRDIARWVERGLIEPGLAQVLADDIDAHQRKSFSFGSILAILAALLFAAALLIFIAANWEYMPRLWRVGLVFAALAAGYIGGAVLKQRDHPAFAEALWLIGAAGFGGAISLIGQMYHLSGDEAQAVLVWCGGTALAALALRSGPLTAGAVVLADAWLAMLALDFWGSTPFPYGFAAVAGVLWALSYWTDSKVARHLILLSLDFYLVLLAIEVNMFTVSVALAIVSAAVFAFAVMRPAEAERLARLDGRLALHGLIGFLTGMTVLQFGMIDELGALVVGAVILFAGIAAALFYGGRDSRAVRWIAYLGFGCQLVFTYVVTLGTMLGTAGFFLLGSATLAILAWVIIRIERRVNAPATPEGAKA